jgi:hypothetical protein
MMLNMKNITYRAGLWMIPVWIVLFSAGCSREENAADDIPVIEAYLIPGQKIGIKVMQKEPYYSDIGWVVSDLDGLHVVVTANEKTVTLTPAGGGAYCDSLGILPVYPDSAYNLSLIYGDMEVTSHTIIPYKPLNFNASPASITFEQRDPENPGFTTPPDPIVLSWTNADTGYYLISVTCIDTNRVSVIKDSVPEDMTGSFQPFVSDTFELHEMMFSYFGETRVILYHINPEYVSFFRTWMNNTQNYEEPPSNILNGLGIFTGINADTCIVNVIQEK